MRAGGYQLGPPAACPGVRCILGVMPNTALPRPAWMLFFTLTACGAGATPGAGAAAHGDAPGGGLLCARGDGRRMRRRSIAGARGHAGGLHQRGSGAALRRADRGGRGPGAPGRHRTPRRAPSSPRSTATSRRWRGSRSSSSGGTRTRRPATGPATRPGASRTPCARWRWRTRPPRPAWRWRWASRGRSRRRGRPETRSCAISPLGLVEIALHAVPDVPGAVGAATKTLEGYVAIERGQRALARTSFEAATRPQSGSRARRGSGSGTWRGATRTSPPPPPRTTGPRGSSAGRRRRPLAPGGRAPRGPGAPRGSRGATDRDRRRAPGAGAASAASLLLVAGRGARRRLAVPGAHAPRGRSLARRPRAGCGARRRRMAGDAAALRGAGSACGPHVAEAVAAASRAFHAAGMTAKSVASARLVLDKHHPCPVPPRSGRPWPSRSAIDTSRSGSSTRRPTGTHGTCAR